MGAQKSIDMELLLPAAGGAWEEGGLGGVKGGNQEAAVVVGTGPVWAVRRPARACPRDKETP